MPRSVQPWRTTTRRRRCCSPPAPASDAPCSGWPPCTTSSCADPDLPAARWFASVVGPDALPEGDPWPDVRRTVLDHRAELTHLIATRSTQTNEVNRCVYLAAGLGAVCADLPDRPVVLVELGASAGLLLGVDRYRVELTTEDGAVDRPR